MSKSPSQLINAYDNNPDSLTKEETQELIHYIKHVARLHMDSCEYAYLLGWWVLGDWSIPLSPKEAGFE